MTTTISDIKMQMEALFSQPNERCVECTNCGQMSLDEVLCSCSEIVEAFGTTECSHCGLDYLFLPNIMEYSASIPDYELTSYVANAIYKNYIRMCPKLCTCCTPAYATYLSGLKKDAVDWNNYYYCVEKEPKDNTDRAPWGGFR
jgi:hypothetical protein